MRLGERHPILLAIARAVIWGGLFTSIVLLFATALTVHATSQVEFKNAHAFQPVHLQAVLRNK